MFRRSLLRREKLCLVLDLDHTLLHSVKISDVSLDEQDYLNSKSGLITCMKTVGRHSLYNHNGRYTRLRPYVRDFLEQVCQKFELYVYTKGERWYAKEVVRLIDPKSVYFKNKVISKDDSTVRNRKNLDVVLGANATNTVIIDDTESVWKEHKDNIIRINKFNYFSSRNGGGYRLNMDNDELDEDDGALKRILEVLQRVHDKFFEEFPVKNDVRPVLKAVLKENIIIRTSLLLGSGELLSCAAIIGLIQGMHGILLPATHAEVTTYYLVLVSNGGPSVWKEHKDNIIRINKFNYFSSRNGGGHRLNMDNDELDEDDGALKRILEDIIIWTSLLLGNTRRSKLVCIGAKTYYLVLVSNGGPNWGVASKCWF
ncbi:hypothetical protein C5167_003951 [Papaver somniferum]|nr:hypothetical protein C5167_003951 [Papaver somniferum]